MERSRDQRTPGGKCASRLKWIAVAGAAVTVVLVACYLHGHLNRLHERSRRRNRFLASFLAASLRGAVPGSFRWPLWGWTTFEMHSLPP